MSRNYTHIHLLEPEIVELQAAGNSHREIAAKLGLEKSQIKSFFKRKNRRERAEASFVSPKHKGRPRKTPLPPEREYELRINELEREVALLRSFLHAAGRR